MASAIADIKDAGFRAVILALVALPSQSLN